MARQSRANLLVTSSTDHYPTTSTGQQLITFSTTDKQAAHYYENKYATVSCDTELSPVCSCNESVSSYSSCDDHQNHHRHSYSIQKLVVTEPYWKRVTKTLDKNKKNIMMGCIMFVLVSLFIVSTVYLVKSLLVNNFVILSICAIMSLLSALIISIIGIIWVTKHSKCRVSTSM